MTRLLIIKLIVFLISLCPLLIMLYDLLSNHLSPNPIEDLLQRSGTWSLRFLILSFGLTPIRMLTGLGVINRFRRMIGLFAFFYCTIHLSVFVLLEHAVNINFIIEDIVLSQFIQIGLIAFLLLCPLALTSSNGMMRRMGKKWKKIHNMIHVIVPLSILHFFLLVKADYTDPLIYFFIVFIFYSIRGVHRHYMKITG